MEKTMSVEERIRRAEERYSRKIGQTIYSDTKIGNRGEKTGNIRIKGKTRKRLFMQIFIVILIYICFYIGTNREYIFSEGFKKDVNVFFTEKTKIYEMYLDAKSYLEKNILKNNENIDNSEKTIEEEKNKKEEKTQSEENQNNQENNIEKETKEEEIEKNTEENVGGADEIKEETNNISEMEPKKETQMEKDAKEIKSKLSFIKPIEGRISSTFGWRNPTVSTVPKYHTGLDLAANQGTVIKSMTDGKIELSSSEGDYGKHYIVTYENIRIIYAHCSKLYLKEGNIIKQGENIAEVGTTGNSTGPHLHIGIKIDDRWVDPQLVLDI